MPSLNLSQILQQYMREQNPNYMKEKELATEADLRRQTLDLQNRQLQQQAAMEQARRDQDAQQHAATLNFHKQQFDLQQEQFKSRENTQAANWIANEQARPATWGSVDVPGLLGGSLGAFPVPEEGSIKMGDNQIKLIPKSVQEQKAFEESNRRNMESYSILEQFVPDIEGKRRLRTALSLANNGMNPSLVPWIMGGGEKTDAQFLMSKSGGDVDKWLQLKAREAAASQHPATAALQSVTAQRGLMDLRVDQLKTQGYAVLNNALTQITADGIDPWSAEGEAYLRKHYLPLWRKGNPKADPAVEGTADQLYMMEKNRIKLQKQNIVGVDGEGNLKVNIASKPKPPAQPTSPPRTRVAEPSINLDQ